MICKTCQLNMKAFSIAYAADGTLSATSTASTLIGEFASQCLIVSTAIGARAQNGQTAFL
jgi:hypothetical protein